MTAEAGRFTLAEFLAFMLEAAERVEAFTAGLDEATFLADTTEGRMARDAVVYNLGVLGEVARDIRQHHPDAVEQMRDIPFHRLHAMRNLVFHGYHAVDHEIVWTTSTVNVPPLVQSLRRRIAAIEAGSS